MTERQTTPRYNKQMAEAVERSYSKSLFSHENGLWTVFEIVKRPIAKVACEGDADNLIAKLTKLDGLK